MSTAVLTRRTPRRSAHPALVFVRAYVRSMRLYYAFVTGIAGWIGVAYAQRLHPAEATPGKAIVVLTILFLAWGINQIVNDYLGRREDRINAPHRPMVSGELDPRAALAVSGVLLLLSVVIGYLISPLAVVPLVAGMLLNIVYEAAKGVPVLGNLVFGLMIAMCPIFAYVAMTGDASIAFTPMSLAVLLLVALLNGLMTYYTYFKDYEGDKAAGKVTVVVLQGLEASRRVALVLGFLPALCIGLLLGTGVVAGSHGPVFPALFTATLLLQVRTGLLYYRHPTGPQAYYSLATNFRACACGQAMLIALFDPALAVGLYVATYLLIGFLFRLHQDHRA